MISMIILLISVFLTKNVTYLVVRYKTIAKILYARALIEYSIINFFRTKSLELSFSLPEEVFNNRLLPIFYEK